MYLNLLVKVPNVPGKLVITKKGETSYVYYEVGYFGYIVMKQLVLLFIQRKKHRLQKLNCLIVDILL